MSLSPSLLEQVSQEIRGAAHGAKTDMIKRWAALLGKSEGHLWRLIQGGKKRERKGNPLHPEYLDWAKVVFQIKKKPPEEAGEISTEDALALAAQKKEIPEKALAVPVGTYNRIGREQGWTKTTTRANRFQAEKPNHAHHFDASTSKFFYIAKRLGDNDYLLKIHRPAKHYKNKPIPVDALRPWIYGITDDHSGRFICRYVAAQGESAVDSMSFLAWAWEDMGLPDALFADQGMLKKSLPSSRLIEDLGIELPQCMPYAKRAHGKIERPWRTLWKKFESLFFASDWEKFEIEMSEMNRHLSNFIADKYNRLPHRFERGISRMQAWSRINLYGGIVKIPANALATVAKRKKRRVDICGILSYEGGHYEVKGLYDAEVIVYEGVFDDRLVVQDVSTGKRYEVRDFKPLAIGEYRAHPATPHEQLIQQSGNLSLAGQGLYADKEAAPENVIAMPTRVKEDRKIEDAFDVDTHPDITEAMREFFELSEARLEPEEREVVENLIKENGLKRPYVQDLALEMRRAMEIRKAQ